MTFLFACLGISAMYCHAQSDGSYLYDWTVRPNSNPQPISYGYVEQMNGHLHLEIPIGEARHNRSGSGTTQVRLVYDSNFWFPDSMFGEQYHWFPGASWHLLPTQAWAGGEFNGSTSNPIEYTQISDQTGAMHYFPCNTNCFSEDGEGYLLPGGAYGSASGLPTGVYAADGTLIYDLDESDPAESNASFSGQSVIDPNGNFTVLGYNGDFYDTSNILAAYRTGSWVYTASGGIASLGPYYDYFYSVPDMASAGIPMSSPNYSNVTPQYTEHDVQISVSSAFGDRRVPVTECSVSGPTLCVATVVSQLVLPDGTSFTFKYDCDSTVAAQQAYCTSLGGQSAYYGALTQMTTPTGQVFKYSYAPFFDAYQDAGLGLTSRTDADGTWTYSQAAISECSGPMATGCEQTLTTTAPNGRTTVLTTIQNDGAWPVSELVTDGSGNNLSLTTTQWDFSQPNPWLGYASAYVRKQWDMTTLWDSTGAAETKKTAYTYVSPQQGDITKLQEWGYYPGTAPSFPSIADKTTYTSYYTPSTSPIADSYGHGLGGSNLVHKPTSITVCNSSHSDSACPGGGTRVSQTLITYDQYGSSGPASVTGVANHDDQSYGSSQLVRGNPTTIQRWVAGSQYVTQTMTYDTTGQVTSTTDGNGNITNYDYTDSFYIDNGTSSPSAYAPPAATHAFATTVTLPPVNGGTFSTKTGYYYGNQKIAFSMDTNNKSTYYHYADPLDRLTQIVYPLGWTLTQYTSPTQTDIYKALLSSSPSVACTSCLHTTYLLDGMQRVVETVRPDGSKVDTKFNSMGLVQSVSNPYQQLSDPTYGLTSYVYDTLNRVCMQSNPDNSSGQATTCTAKGSSALQFTYVVNGGYKTDENGNTWEYLYDPLGRLASVSEPNGAITQYTNDVIGNLVNVSQTGVAGAETARLRSFTYDGLSRLLTSTNPETGTICYGVGLTPQGGCFGGYDANGNLLYKTDARNVTTNFTYDNWNRLISKTYTNDTSNTLSSCYQYDTAANGIGRLTASWTQAGSCSASLPTTGAITSRAILAYDSMGRVKKEQQCTPGNCTTTTPAPYELHYDYDLAGNLTHAEDGIGQASWFDQYDNAGRLSGVSALTVWPTTFYPALLFSAQGYSPAGGLTNWTLGIPTAGQAALTGTKSYDNRFRPLTESVSGHE